MGDSLFPFTVISIIAYLFLRPHIKSMELPVRVIILILVFVNIWAVFMPSSCRPTPENHGRFLQQHAPDDAAPGMIP